MAYLTLLAAVVLSFVTAFFAVQNSTLVTVNLFLWTIESSLAVVILSAATLGFATALFLGMFIQIRLRYRLYRANRRISQLEAELAERPQSSPEEKTSNAEPSEKTPEAPQQI